MTQAHAHESASEITAHKPPGGRALRVAPRLSRSYLPRPRLTGILNDEWPVVVLHAPSGYGKTSVLAEWAKHYSDRPGLVWITLDERLSRSQFWSHVRSTLVRQGLVERDSIELSSLETREPAASRLSILEMIESSQAPVDLVVDAARAATSRELDGDLLFVLQHSEHVRVRLASRSSTTFNDVATAVALDRRIVDLRELQFTFHETRQLAALSSVEASTTHLHQLHRSTEGWPFAIRTAMQLRSQHLVKVHDPRFHDAPFDEAVSYLQKRVLDDLTEIPRFRYLLPTAVLETFTAEQAEALGADPADAGVLTEIESRGLGTWESSGATPRFRVQPLLREALLDRIPRADLREIYTRLSEWWAERDVARAFHAAIGAEDWTLAAQLARRDLASVATSIVRDERSLAHVPRAALRSEPMLSVLAGLGHYTAGEIPRAMRTFALAVAKGEQLRALRADSTTIDHVWTQGLVAVALRLMGRWDLVPAGLRSFERMLARVDDPEGELATASPIILNQIASTHLLLDQVSEAQAALAHRRATRAASAMPRRRVYADSLEALLDSLDGDVDGARRKVEAITRPGLPKDVIRGFHAVPLHLAQAHSYLEGLDPASALAELNETRPFWTSIEIWPVIAHARTLTKWMLAGPETALVLLDEIRVEKRARPAISAAMTSMLDALAAEMLLALGRGAEARALTSARRRRAHPRLTIPAARDHLISGEHHLALGLADSAARNTSLSRLRLDALAIAAAAANRASEIETARARFRSAIDLAGRTGMRLPLLAMPREDFLSLADAEEISPELRDLVATAPPAFPEPGAAVKLTPRERIVVEELATGSTIPEIARRLTVSANTVKAQTRSVSRKLGTSGRADLIAEARRRGVL